MKINSKIFSIPPYISTTWMQITTLRVVGSNLIVNLNDGDSIEIPGLDTQMLDTIFNTHAAYIESQYEEAKMNQSVHPLGQLTEMAQPADSPFRISFNTIDELGSVLHHNPAQAQAPNIPQDILQKIVAITKIVAPDESIAMPKPEEHCNCVHCQIARAVHTADSPNAVQQLAPVVSEKDETIKDTDLEFQQWEIVQADNQLYTVVNRLDSMERYSVYLGQPVGCTCGKSTCEHIVAVLRS